MDILKEFIEVQEVAEMLISKMSVLRKAVYELTEKAVVKKSRDMSRSLRRLEPHKERIRMMLRNGASVANVGRMFSAPRNAVSQFINEELRGWKVRGRGWVFLSEAQTKVRRHERLSEWIDEGYSPISIAKELGVEEEDVEKVMEYKKLQYVKSEKKWQKI